MDESEASDTRMYFIGSHQPLSVPDKYKRIKKAFHAVKT